MGILKRAVTFSPPFWLRIAAGLAGFLISMSVCLWTYVFDVSRNLNARDINFRGRSIEQGARYYKDQCARCHGIEGKGVEGQAPGISNVSFLGQLKYAEVDGQRVLQAVKPSARLADIKYTGTLRDYVRSVIASGLPIKSSADWAAPHPPAAEAYGGPLREDTVEDVTNFVLNWGIAPYPDSEAIMPAQAGGVSATPVPLSAEAEAGKQVYLKSGCNACHSIKGAGNQGSVGPSLNHIFKEAGDIVASADYTGKVKGGVAKTAEEYITQSINDPNAYIYPKCPTAACAAGLMPQNFKTVISPADFKTLMAFLVTLK